MPDITRYQPLITRCIDFEHLSGPPTLISSHVEFTAELLNDASGPTRKSTRYQPLTASRINFDTNTLETIPLIASRIDWNEGRLTSSECEPHSGSGTPGLPEPGSHNPTIPASKGKIPKPSGEPGRPNSGGYNAERLLTLTYGWKKADYEKLSVRILFRSFFTC